MSVNDNHFKFLVNCVNARTKTEVLIYIAVEEVVIKELKLINFDKETFKSRQLVILIIELS